MNISPDWLTVRFHTEPNELFEAEKSGAKPNTVRILDANEYRQLRQANPQKIIIQHEQEFFVRTITHIYVTDIIFEKVAVVISWINEKHHHPTSISEKPDIRDHTMSLDEVHSMPIEGKPDTIDEADPEPPLPVQAIYISLHVFEKLNFYRGAKTTNEFISDMLDVYLGTKYPDTSEWHGGPQ